MYNIYIYKQMLSIGNYPAVEIVITNNNNKI